MGQINLIRAGGTKANDELSKNVNVNHLFSETFCDVIEITIRNGERLTKHKADVPISVLCLSGTGTFSAGSDLDDSVALSAGTMLTLEPGIEHEVAAETDLCIVVTRFQCEPAGSI